MNTILTSDDTKRHKEESKHDPSDPSPRTINFVYVL